MSCHNVKLGKVKIHNPNLIIRKKYHIFIDYNSLFKKIMNYFLYKKTFIIKKYLSPKVLKISCNSLTKKK